MSRRGVRARELEVVEVVEVGASKMITIIPCEGIDQNSAFLVPTDAFVRVRPPKGLSRAWVESLAEDLAKSARAVKIEWPREDAVATEPKTVAATERTLREVVREMVAAARGVDVEKLGEFCERRMSEEKL